MVIGFHNPPTLSLVKTHMDAIQNQMTGIRQLLLYPFQFDICHPILSRRAKQANKVTFSGLTFFYQITVLIKLSKPICLSHPQLPHDYI